MYSWLVLTSLLLNESLQIILQWINMAYIGFEIVTNEWKSVNGILSGIVTYEIELLLTNGMEFKCLLDVSNS